MKRTITSFSSIFTRSPTTSLLARLSTTSNRTPYHPSNIAQELPDTFPSPFPGGAVGTDLPVFNGIHANGDWNLFIVDDTGNDAGSLTGWVLQFQIDPVPEPSTWFIGMVGFAAFFARRFLHR